MFRLITALILITFAIAACGSSAESPADEVGYIVVKAAAINPGDPVPPPTGPVILTVTGKLETTNAGESLQFDMETLDRLGLVEYRVEDKQAEGREATFRGVLLSQLLAVAGIRPEAATLHTVALNDYAVEIPITDALGFPVLIATAVDGERMAVDRYGPIRIIYPYETYDLDPTIYDPRWIWQLTSIDVR